MAILPAQLNNSKGLPIDATVSNSYTLIASVGSYADSLLFSSAYIQVSKGQLLNSTSKLIVHQQYKQGKYVNYLSRLARFFGDNAKQTNTHLIIQKSDLPSLTPKLSNTAESLLLAIILRVMLYESNSIISKTTVTFFKTEFLKVNLVPIIQTILIINLFATVTKFEIYEIVHKTNVSPNDY